MRSQALAVFPNDSFHLFSNHLCMIQLEKFSIQELKHIQIIFREKKLNFQPKRYYYIPEMHRGIGTNENLSLPSIYRILYPVQYCFNGPLICFFYLHFQLHFHTFLEITASGQLQKKRMNHFFK